MPWILVALGATLSAWGVSHDFQRMLIHRQVPQAAPSRMPPEIHAPAALLTAAGSWWLAGWPLAAGVLVGHLVIAWAALPWLLDRIEYRQ